MGSRRTLRAQVSEALEALGPRASDVANSLAVAGVRGVSQETERCALAVYLNAVLGGERRIHRVVVRAEELEIGCPRRPKVFMRYPPGVSAFIAAFDRGFFPNLLLPRPSETDRHSEPAPG